jgi:hypothetical protein
VPSEHSLLLDILSAAKCSQKVDSAREPQLRPYNGRFVGYWEFNFWLARHWVRANLEILEREWRIRICPGCVKFRSNLLSSIVLVFSFQGVQKAKQRARISGILFQISSKHGFSLLRLSAQQQGTP